MMRPRGLVWVVLLAVLAMPACSSHKNGGPALQRVVDLRTKKHVDIDAQNNLFTPPDIAIAPGTTVTWTNHDSVAHNVQKAANNFILVAPGLGVQADKFGPGATYSYTFHKLGVFNYTCTIHSFMNGTIRVEAPPPTTVASTSRATSTSTTKP